MPGGNDPDNRRMMRFDDLNEDEQRVLETVKSLSNLRMSYLPLIYGDFKTLLLTDQKWAYCRTYFDEIVIIVMNKDAQAKNLTFDLPKRFAEIKPVSHFGNIPGTRAGKMTITLRGRSFDIITAHK
jgi:cyclomaltodextrinase